MALEKRVEGFGDTANEVIKRLLASSPQDDKTISQNRIEVPKNKPIDPHPLIKLIESPRFQINDAKERYFSVLEFLYRENSDRFAQLEGFRLGSRVNISREARKIEASGKSTQPQKLMGTPYYVLTNLDNKRKRNILEDILKMFHYPSEVISCVIKSIPDSGISRPKRINTIY